LTGAELTCRGMALSCGAGIRRSPAIRPCAQWALPTGNNFYLSEGVAMKNVDKQTLNCLKSEKQQLMDDVRRCDLCSTSMEDHSRCYEDAARESGVRSKSCFV
jgi:hypothetical protein